MINIAVVLLRGLLKYSMALGIFVMIIYEFGLLCFGWKTYVLYGPRNDLFSANREGIVSSCGYLAIFLFGVELGRNILKSLYILEHKNNVD